MMTMMMRYQHCVYLKNVYVHLQKITIFGQNNKAKASVSQQVIVSATGCQSFCTIVAEGQVPVIANHDWHFKNIIPSVALCMNITSDP